VSFAVLLIWVFLPVDLISVEYQNIKPESVMTPSPERRASQVRLICNF